MTVTAPRIALEEWLDMVVAAAEEVARDQLAWDGFRVLARGDEPPATDVGSYVALIGDEGSAQLGIVASLDDCRTMSRCLLALAEEEEVTDGDLCDAVGEIANILGGAVKRRVAQRFTGFKLGLPLFMQGRILPSERQEVATMQVAMGPIQVRLVVVRNRSE